MNSLTFNFELKTDDLSLSNDLAISFLTRNDPDTTDCTPNILIINPISSFIPPST